MAQVARAAAACDYLEPEADPGTDVPVWIYTQIADAIFAAAEALWKKADMCAYDACVLDKKILRVESVDPLTVGIQVLNCTTGVVKFS